MSKILLRLFPVCPALLFFSQIANAILFKKWNRTSSETAHKIYVDKFQNSFLVKPEPHDGPTESDHAAGDSNRRDKHRSQPHWKYAAERIQLRPVTPIPSDRSQSAAIQACRKPAAATDVLQKPKSASVGIFLPLMICIPDERKNTFHGRMLRTGLGGDGSWTVRRNQPRRPLWGGAGGCGRCMVLEGDLPVVGGGGRHAATGLMNASR